MLSYLFVEDKQTTNNVINETLRYYVNSNMDYLHACRMQLVIISYCHDIYFVELLRRNNKGRALTLTHTMRLMKLYATTLTVKWITYSCVLRIRQIICRNID